VGRSSSWRLLRHLAHCIHRDPMDDGVAHLGSVIALGKDERGEAGTFAHLVWTERENLLLK